MPLDNLNSPRTGISRRRLLLGSASLLAGTRLVLAQQPTPSYSTDVKVVNVLATVRTKKGDIVRSLNKDDFSLEEDGRPQTIKYFAQETDLPLTLGLLVDTSLSQRRLIESERRAAYRFFDQVLREDKDVAFVIHFDRETELLQDLTPSKQKLEAALSQLDTPSLERRGGGGQGGGGYPGGSGGGYPGGGGGRYPGGGGGRRGGGTVLYDAVLLASEELMRNQLGRKAVVLLTDGVDTGSKVTLERAIEAASRYDTLVYSVLFADHESYGSGMGMPPRMGGRRGGGMPRRTPAQNLPDGKKVLQRLAKETGGGFFEVSKKHPIETVFSMIEEELRHQYNLGYTPDRAGEGYRRIHLATRDKELIVQTRDGYYAR